MVQSHDGQADGGYSPGEAAGKPLENESSSWDKGLRAHL